MRHDRTCGTVITQKLETAVQQLILYGRNTLLQIVSQIQKLETSKSHGFYEADSQIVHGSPVKRSL